MLRGMRRPLPIWMVIFPDAQILDASGPVEVFSLANRLGRERGPRYEVTVVAPAAGPVATSSGLPPVAGRSIRQATGPGDTLIVAGGPGTPAALRDARPASWVRRPPPPGAPAR